MCYCRRILEILFRNTKTEFPYYVRHKCNVYVRVLEYYPLTQDPYCIIKQP